MYEGVFRTGDVIRFRRGSNEYVGTVVRIYGVAGGLEVQAERIGGVRVSVKHVTQVVEPVLTPKEEAALHALAAERASRAHPRERVTVRELAASGPAVSGTTMHGLTQRGLVRGAQVPGVKGTAWELTEEGRRVAQSRI